MNLALATRLGYKNNADVAAGLFRYHVYDTFTTNRSAGTIDNTAVEPGPGGLRDVVDSSSILSLTGGKAVFSVAAVTNDPRIIYKPVSVYAGLVMKTIWNPASTSEVFSFGMSSSIASTSAIFRFNSGGVIAALFSGGVNVATYSAGVTYEAVLVHRTPGYFWFLKDSVSGLFKMIGFGFSFGTVGQLLYPILGSRGTGPSMSCEEVKVPVAPWLPVPLVSDGFSAWGTSDGLGHQEGVAGGLGSGGSGKAWTQNVGTWQAVGGVASASALAGSLAIATVDLSTADVFASVKLTVASGSCALLLRYVDTANFVLIRRTTTNVQLSKIIGGVETSVQDTVVTYVAGAELKAVCEGTKFRLFYNNAAVGTEQTISDAILQSGTKCGIRSTVVTDNTFEDFVVYARGTSDEYAEIGSF